jgi:hypothetical protein
MSTPGQSRALTQLAPALRPHLAELVDRTLKRITTSIASYRDEATHQRRHERAEGGGGR